MPRGLLAMEQGMDAEAPSATDGIEDPILGMEMKLEKQEGLVFLDDTNDGQVLTHVTTLRRQQVPTEGRPYDIVFDEGFGALVAQDGTLKPLEQFLTRQLYKALNGDLFVIDTHEFEYDGDHGAGVINLTSKMRAFVQYPIYLSMNGTKIKFTGYVMEWPRGGGRIMWQLHDLYDHLGLETYKGIASKWVYCGCANWDETLSALGLHGHIVRSVNGVNQMIAMGSTSHCLPAASMTTIGVLVMLARWSCASTRNGGLRGRESKDKGLNLLRAFIDASASIGFSIDLAFDKEWMPRWPRPQKPCDCRVRLFVDTNGIVDLGPWRQRIDAEVDYVQAGISTMVAWYELVVEATGRGDGRVRLVDMLLAGGLSNDSEYLGAWLQLVWQIAERLEILVFKSRGMDECPYKIWAEPAAPSDSWEPRAVDATCQIHIASTKKATTKVRCMGIASDKVGGARGLDLQNAFAVLPNNIAFELVPQVCFVTWSNSARRVCVRQLTK